jgi:hypothetical protein
MVKDAPSFKQAGNEIKMFIENVTWVAITAIV